MVPPLPQGLQWFSEFPEQAAVRACQRQANRNLVATELYARGLKASVPDLPATTAFAEMVKGMRTLPPGALGVVMISPRYSWWVTRADRVLLRLNRGKDALTLISSSTIEDDIRELVDEFWDFMLELAILVRRPLLERRGMESDVFTCGHRGLRVSVPPGMAGQFGVDIVQAAWAAQLGDHVGQIDSLIDRRMGLPLEEGDIRYASPVTFDGLQSFVDDETVGLSWGLPIHSPPASCATAAMVAAELQESLRLLGAVWPELGRSVMRVLQLFVPHSGAAGVPVPISLGHHLFGTVYMCHTGSALSAAVALVSAAGQQTVGALMADSSAFPGTAAPPHHGPNDGAAPCVGWPSQRLIGRAMGLDAALGFLSRVATLHGADALLERHREALITDAQEVLNDLRLLGPLPERGGGFFADFGYRLQSQGGRE